MSGKLQEHNYPYNIRQLFFRRFSCLVPSIALRSNFELRERGVFAMGDENETAALHDELVDTSLTINKIFEIWRQGYSVTIAKESDCLLIFNIVTEHIQQWVNFLNLGVQVDDGPFEDLLGLDAFVDVVYKYARHERAKRNIPLFESMVSSDLGFNLSPLTNTGGFRQYNSLLNDDQTNMTLNPKLVAKEDRKGFSEEIVRLGGRISKAVKQNERESIFSSVRFGEERKG